MVERPSYSPRIVACPVCKATIGEGCYTLEGEPITTYHAARHLKAREPFSPEAKTLRALRLVITYIEVVADKTKDDDTRQQLNELVSKFYEEYGHE